jgi:hypothetical protein
MASKVNCTNRPRGAPWRALHAGRSDDYPAMVDQGLRLNRAFIRINDPLVREAIVNLAVEAAKNEGGVDIRPADRMLLRDRPAKTEFLPSG